MIRANLSNIPLGYHKVSLGVNQIIVENEIMKGIIKIEVEEIYTFVLGTCYLIKTKDISIPPPKFVMVTLSFNGSMNEVDFPKVCLLVRGH